MSIIIPIFVTVFVFGLVSTPIVRRIALKSGFVAMPKSDRAHTEPTALMGGLAIYMAAVAGLLVIIALSSALGGDILGLREFASIIMTATLMSAVGLWDDRRPLKSWAKLALQLGPVLLLFMAGARVNLPLLDIGIWDTLLNLLITTCWILYITNAINYLDNADGIAAMTSATASAIFLLIAVLNHQQLVQMLAAAVLGASLSFAYFNLPLPKSKIFMGDSGSLFLGFLLAILGIKIRIPTNHIQITWMVPVIVLGLPIFDTLLVFISRTRRGVSFFRGGVDHSTHRLARLGMNGLSVAFAVSLICGVLGLIAIFITQATLTEAYTVAGFLIVFTLYALWHLEFKASYTFRTGREPPPEERKV
jgi:UDP-GlcNAc:undecaprenyl-phosphate GlcNAc-1-phosphate transferase